MGKISQNISSDSLFHFVKRREWLFQILKSKSFQARYVYEEIPELKYKVGIPMKCFCDIPLGIIKKHLNKYGKFGIGLSKEFAKRKSLSPIIYVHKNSDTLLRYLDSMRKPDIFNDPNSLLPYIKWDQRKYKSTDGKTLRDRYYDEREWRYIPKEPAFVDFTDFHENEIKKNKLEEINKQLDEDKNKYSFPFEYSDITYIFVQQDKDVDKVIEEIHKVKLPGLQSERLIAKITTARQIERDF